MLFIFFSLVGGCSLCRFKGGEGSNSLSSRHTHYMPIKSKFQRKQTKKLKNRNFSIPSWVKRQNPVGATTWSNPLQSDWNASNSDTSGGMGNKAVTGAYRSIQERIEAYRRYARGYGELGIAIHTGGIA